MVFVSKSDLRLSLLKQRNSLSADQVQILSRTICDNVLLHPRFISAKIVFLYSSFGSEVSTRDLIIRAVSLGKEVYLPVLVRSIVCAEGIDKNGNPIDMTPPPHLAFRQFTSFSEMKIGEFGIMEPTSNLAPLKAPDLIIVPGVGFDLHGHRLGYGKGYYDRLLQNSSGYRIGIGFDFQIIDKIPDDSHDQKMDEIVSEKRNLKILKG
ncbi:5-formyltetrahydrofolate cyclo-ligase [Candidatus Micrarchaeota archaeon]|nr:5-formyltetrahydrofolate cyclo-ligase [Candidatus Micrarchaeota archaeon]